ncbi:archaellar assembly protein FlaJ [Candidatus Woesearchaeota archaeon]|nr:MAG: archaellar assembly protein FlaJ [Candidatus Woesearchaeota archaeon]
MDRLIALMGFDKMEDFLLKFVIPVIGVSILLFFSTMLFLSLPFWVPYLFLLGGIIFIAAYPVILRELKKVEIHENIHFFITYAGTISTLHINRTMLFKKIAEGRKYGVISDTAEKIVYLAKAWNLGFARTCRKMAALAPSRIFGDFLDRFAAVLDFGEDLETFLTEEQDAVMDDYETEYKKSLESIKMLQEVFISMTISIAFGMAAALLLPLIMGISIMVVIKWALLALIVMDMLMVLLIKGFIPSDTICHDLPIKDEGTKRLHKSLMITFPVSFILLALLFWWNRLPFLTNLAVASTPLIVSGLLAVEEENDVFRRDKAFPAFIRSLGGTIYVRQGGVISSLGALRVHDFGILNPMVINLYRRLRLGSDRFKSWIYFAGETGSNMIKNFINIFAESVYLGGNAQQIANIISKNFTRLLSLRKLRLQLASGLRGSLYGALLGFTTTVYMSAAITKLLSGMFSSAFEASQVQGEMASIVSSILPPIPSVDMFTVNIYIGVMVLVHSIMSALMVKLVDGGNKYAALFDMNLMLWLGALLGWGVPKMANWAFGTMALG